MKNNRLFQLQDMVTHRCCLRSLHQACQLKNHHSLPRSKHQWNQMSYRQNTRHVMNNKLLRHFRRYTNCEILFHASCQMLLCLFVHFNKCLPVAEILRGWGRGWGCGHVSPLRGLEWDGDNWSFISPCCEQFYTKLCSSVLVYSECSDKNKENTIISKISIKK